MSNERLHVHMIHPPPDSALAALREAIDAGIDLSVGMDVLEEAQVLVAGRPTREQLATSKMLRALVIPYAGVPDTTRDLLLAEYPHLDVYNLHHNAMAAAELAIGLLLAAAKTLLPVDRSFREHDWRSRYDGAPTLLLEGKRALILGLGAIGTRLATLCDAFGMTVSAIRANPERLHPQFVDVHGPDTLHALLPIADVLLICLPLTTDSTGLIGQPELALLPSSAILVNIARGPIVDEEALYCALAEKRIAAAGVDVWYNYPKDEPSRANTPPSAYPFHELDNVVMSPHRGGAFRLEELEAKRMADLAATLNAIARGECVPHRVDLEAGY